MLPARDRELDQIKKECRSMVTKRALIAGGVAIIPVPGVDIAADIGCLMELLPKISGRFGLLPEQIDHLDTQTKTLIYSLAMVMGNQMIGKVLTKQLVVQVLKKVGVRLAAKQVAKYIPIAGQAVSATLSFAAMQYVCNSHIDDCYKISQQVITQTRH